MSKKSISVKVIIITALVFVVLIVCFNVFDITYDSSKNHYYTQQQIAKMQVELVNINTASAEQLCTLKGIGKSTAQNIINYRNQHGNFETIEDLKNVKGIKSSTFLEIKPMITV